jgi:acetolactate synthase-1/2/3 large subunit
MTYIHPRALHGLVRYGSTYPGMCSLRLFENAQRPVILLGNGARNADAARLLTLGVPVLSSWQAADLVDNFAPMYFGRPGIYGQRCANKILYEADYVLAIGNRCSIWNVGYEGFRADQRLVMVDVDIDEMRKFGNAVPILWDAGDFIDEIDAPEVSLAWLSNCHNWRVAYPWVESWMDNLNYISPYRFMQKLQPLLREDECIVADVGTANVCASQVLRLKPPQRLMSSGGLGEMGCALPAAIGASFARGNGEVLCLQCDGSMMMNLQELQTIVHHKLPVKIIVFSNDGYAMIRRSQNVLGYMESGIGAANGVSMPSFRKLAHAWGMPACDVRTWSDFEKAIPSLFAAKGPALVEVFTDPNQTFLKLNPIMVDGKATSPEFWNLSPCAATS